MIHRIPGRLRIALFLLLPVVAVRFVLLPLYDWQQHAREEIYLTKKKILRLEGLEKNGSKLKAVHEEAEGYIRSLEKHFQTDITSLDDLQLKAQKVLEQIVAESGVSSQGINWMYASADGFVMQTPLRITFHSSLEQFYDFMCRVETYPQFFTIDSFQLSKFKQNSMRAIVDISAYARTGEKK
jgi:Tfp pilus assembly protein PilO